jgi:hypothetical protein
MDGIELSVERRAPSGTTGMRVCFRSRAGNSFSSKAASRAPMWRTAQSPRNGMEPCAMLALRLDLRPPDAAMAEADAVLVERLGDDDVIDARLREIALRARWATPPKPPDSSSTVPEISIAPG